MGAQESDLRAEAETVAVAHHQLPHTHHYRELFADLTTSGQQDFKSRFEAYFGGPCPSFGCGLYDQLFSGPVSEAIFVESLSQLTALCGEAHSLDHYCFSIFSHKRDTITKQEITELIKTAATFGLVSGSELHEKAVLPPDHALITSLVNAAWVQAADDKLGRSTFSHWVTMACPGLLHSMQHWILSLATHSHSHGYLLPTHSLPQGASLDKQIDHAAVVWLLSTLLPPPYMGHAPSKHNKDKVLRPLGGQWSCLYSSGSHGFSMNRFQHHCSDYKHSSIMVVDCYHSGQKQVYQFAIALDTEWRDGTYYYGGDDSLFVQLQPTFHPMRRGSKFLSLNEKTRGFPTGLQIVGTNSSVLFLIEPTLDKASFLGDSLIVDRIEVWGCGGQEAELAQQRIKEWEKRQVVLRGKVRRDQLAENWENSPDRLILEMGGVTTRRSTEQQQQ